MIVISDTSPILYLLLINHLDLRTPDTSLNKLNPNERAAEVLIQCLELSGELSISDLGFSSS